MLEIHELVEVGEPAKVLELPFELRQKSRLKAQLSDGEMVGLFLPRGTVLRHGALLKTDSGDIIEVRAAPEEVSTVSGTDDFLLTRVAYHLGNRHVPLQVGRGFLRYQHDHVLDAMVRQLGAQVRFEQAPFEPESGAYGDHGGHGHGHGHGHEHDDRHRHDLTERPVAPEPGESRGV